MNTPNYKEKQMITHEEVLEKVRMAKAADDDDEIELQREALCAFAEYFAQQVDVRKEELPYLLCFTAIINELMKQFCKKSVIVGGFLAGNLDDATEEKLVETVMTILNIEEG